MNEKSLLFQHQCDSVVDVRDGSSEVSNGIEGIEFQNQVLPMQFLVLLTCNELCASLGSKEIKDANRFLLFSLHYEDLQMILLLCNFLCK